MQYNSQKASDTSVISEGVGLIGRITASVAVIKLALRAVQKSPSDWLSAILKAYTDLFHPIVDYTIGLAPQLFGYVFESWTKDLIIINTLVASSVTRAIITGVRQNGEKVTPIQWIGAFGVSFLLWPALAIVTGITGPLLSRWPGPISDDQMLQAYWKERSAYFTPLAKRWRKELLLVFVIVGVTLALNAAGEL